ncbi:transposase [Streptomyces sp. NPDC019507]|uniref:transposase n=1 Tax=Streptomyces sp. NPDC019507 TaxID=3154689 RepID=UPI0033DEE5B4
MTPDGRPAADRDQNCPLSQNELHPTDIASPTALSWCQILDALRLGPTDDVAEVTAAQVRRVVENLIDMDRWTVGDRDILVVFDAGYDAPRMAHLLEGLPAQVLGRMRTDRVMRKPVPVPSVSPPQGGRPPKHGKEFRFAKPDTRGEPVDGLAAGETVPACAGAVASALVITRAAAVTSLTPAPLRRFVRELNCVSSIRRCGECLNAPEHPSPPCVTTGLKGRR